VVDIIVAAVVVAFTLLLAFFERSNLRGPLPYILLSAGAWFLVKTVVSGHTGAVIVRGLILAAFFGLVGAFLLVRNRRMNNRQDKPDNLGKQS
jgi:membrane-bound ClpP family serine protease